MQTQKIVNLALLIASAISFMIFSRVIDFAWDMGRLTSFNDWPVGPQHLISLVLAGVVGLGVRLWERGNQFLNEVVLELSKVSWPLGKETLASSGVVVVLVSIAALLLAVVDMIWTRMAIKVFEI